MTCSFKTTKRDITSVYYDENVLQGPIKAPLRYQYDMYAPNLSDILKRTSGNSYNGVPWLLEVSSNICYRKRLMLIIAGYR